MDLLYCGATPVFGFLYPVYGSVAGIEQCHDRDPQERNLMLTCRQYGGFIAGAVVGVITIPIVQKSADPRTGWLISVGIVCVTMIITGLCAANGAKRVDYYNSLPTPEKIHFKSQIGLVIHNRAVICAALLLGAVTLVNTMSSALSLYYLRCVVENMGLKAVFSLVSLGISLVVIPMMPAMLRKIWQDQNCVYRYVCDPAPVHLAPWCAGNMPQILRSSAWDLWEALASYSRMWRCWL